MKGMLGLLQYIKPYKLFAILGPLFMCVEVAMDLLQPTIMQMIIDTGIANSDNAYVIKFGLFMLLSAFIGLLGGVGSSIYATKAAVNFATDIRRDVFRKTEQFSNRNTESFGTGKLITIVTNDLAAIQQALMMTLRVFVRGPLLFIGSVVIVWMTARELFPVLLVAIPILIICIYFFSVKSGKLFGLVQKAMDLVNTKLQESLAGIRVIKAFDSGHYENSQFTTVNANLTKRNLSAEQVVFTLMPIMMFVVNIAVVAGLWLGAIKVNEGSLQVGVILAFINYLNIMLNGLMSSSNVLMQITRSFPSAERVEQVLQTEIELDEPDNPEQHSTIKGDIEFRQVNFSYSKNGEYVLKDISFEVKQGQTVGIIGSTGSGKSTLVKLIPRLYDPDTGEILIDGVNIKEYSLEELRSAIGFVPQKAILFSGTIEDNLHYGKEDATEAEMEIAVESAAASEFIQAFDDTYTHTLLQGATNLSGGQKQRLSMSRAFIRDPKILVLDDSTSAIDALSEAKVQQSLKQMFPQTTVVIISAKISSIIHADKILVMEDGMIEAMGTHEELVITSKVYQDIYATQNGKEDLSYE
ncbi:ABC transporter ATP-binding protein [Mesobacillus maritimus]|uniref:ABC transporter ATP-binding protein n=1 Tax=Mesobacillus maritimus TaxID=1643336 RepID=A0ABS7K8Y5_9BACI|nr:ABC transporter ATP-binding protein [Mesobacillus maritimus]MBY0098551.1 ABC transporter ATP-binding protein [Mesobacillus maritimus]